MKLCQIKYNINLEELFTSYDNKSVLIDKKSLKKMILTANTDQDESSDNLTHSHNDKTLNYSSTMINDNNKDEIQV